MKKTILFLMLLGLFVACGNKNVPHETDTKNEANDTTTTTTPVTNDDNNEKDNNTEADQGTVIDSSECYWIQTFNELGEPVEAYDCMTFDQKVGNTFDEALATVMPELDVLIQRMVNDEKGDANFEAERWELRQVVRDVKNSPNENLVYTSLELYMYSNIWCAYTIVYQFCVIDSDGNLYQIIGPAEGDNGENKINE